MQKTRNAPPALSAANSLDYLAYFNAHRDSLVATTRELVEAESPSDHKPSLDSLAGLLAAAFANRGGKLTLHRSRTAGNHVQADFPGLPVWVAPNAMMWATRSCPYLLRT